jgi:hypothetical protein
MITAVLMGFAIAVLVVIGLRMTPAARAVSPDRWLRDLAAIAAAFGLAAAIAALMAAIFGSGMLAEERGRSGATLPTQALVFGMLVLGVTAGTLLGCRHFAIRHKRFRRLLRGRGRGEPRPW